MRGFRILRDDINHLDLLMNYKPNDVFATLNEMSHTLKDVKTFPELLVMEYVPGKEYSVDVLANNGLAPIVIPRWGSVSLAPLKTMGGSSNILKRSWISSDFMEI